ncbi:hypothetical protein NUM_51850 [Actinocatenispora comari]|uniref:Uncharacterized protein n=1 Tax=Actinocatenispora comari TaxID=2807577 RepID=A0A8J4EMU5_9ACTN|nr:hypothetical protein NUM_51850 [Actinocatenispora comari]
MGWTRLNPGTRGDIVPGTSSTTADHRLPAPRVTSENTSSRGQIPAERGDIVPTCPRPDVTIAEPVDGPDCGWWLVASRGEHGTDCPGCRQATGGPDHREAS